MIVTYMILCHKNPDQVKLLIDLLNCDSASFVIHIDKKSEFEDYYIAKENVVYVPAEERVSVRWGGISMVDAVLKMMHIAIEQFDSSYYWVCSGQDLPLVKARDICARLSICRDVDYIHFFQSMNNGLDCQSNYDKRNQVYFPEWLVGPSFPVRVIKRGYVELTGGYKKTWKLFFRKHYFDYKFYFGSNWMCLRREVIVWILNYLENHSEVRQFFAGSLNPDECFFHTLYMASPFAGDSQDYLHYVDWSQGGNSPKVLKVSDLDLAFSSGKLMGRKFDLENNPGAVERVVDLIS